MIFLSLQKGRISPLVVRHSPDRPTTEMCASVSPPGSPLQHKSMLHASPKGTRAAAPMVKMMKQVVTSPTETVANKQRHDDEDQGERKSPFRAMSMSTDRKQSWRHVRQVQRYKIYILTDQFKQMTCRLVGINCI